MKITRLFLAAFFALTILANPVPSRAWGSAGHETVGAIADQLLTNATKDHIKTLLSSVPTFFIGGTSVVVDFRNQNFLKAA